MKYYKDLQKIKELINELNKIIAALNETNELIIEAIKYDFNLEYRDIYKKMGISRQHFYFYKKNPHWRFNLKLLNLYFKLCEEQQQQSK